MRSKRLFRLKHTASLLLLVLVLLGTILAPRVYAAGITFVQKSGVQATSPFTFTNVVSGDLLYVTQVTNSAGCGMTVSDSFGDVFTSQGCASANDGTDGCNVQMTVWTATAGQSGSDVFSFSGSTSIDISEYSGVTGVGTGVLHQSNTTSDTITVTQNNQAEVESAFGVGFSGSCASLSYTFNSNQIQRSTGSASGFLYVTGDNLAVVTGPTQYSISFSALSTRGWIHILVPISGTPAPNIIVSTQCYGNCGNPAITLANTNSTHTVNFNQTITLFYEFQSNLNGFLLNVTISMAKSYVNLPNGPGFGVYVIPFCPSGQAPFSPQCPGLLQAQSPGQSFFAPPKGKISFSGLHVPVSNGQWVGIALSAFQSGLDVNDTNTNVPLFQTNEGKIPSSIQQPSSLGNSKVGLWAWITGNIVTGGPSPFPSGGACGPGLDLILSCVVTSSCSIVTIQCQTGVSIFWVIILTVVTLAVTLGLFSYWLPNLNLSTKGMGEFSVLIFIGWFAMFGAIGLLLPWLMILLFFVIAWLFLGRSKGTGPI